MSRKTELEADLKRVGYQLGGSHLTRQARSATFRTFADTLRQLGYGIHCAKQIGGKHLQAFATARAAHGIAARTCANEMSHLRAVLGQIGKEGLARNPGYSNAALGIAPGRRIGTKEPLTDAALLAFQDRMTGLGRAHLGAVLELQRALGLREAEAIRAGQAETLSRWQRELTTRGSAGIIEGTKGGRPRQVRPANVERAMAAIQHALAALQGCATHMLRAGAPIRHLQEMLGHASIETTQIYTRVTITDLKEVHRRFHPREQDTEADEE